MRTTGGSKTGYIPCRGVHEEVAFGNGVSGFQTVSLNYNHLFKICISCLCNVKDFKMFYKLKLLKLIKTPFLKKKPVKVNQSH